MSKIVCQGARCSCPVGTGKNIPLSVTSQQKVKINGKLVATIKDMVPGKNIPPFGTCNTLTAAASGVATPCALAPVGFWSPGSLVTKIMASPVLTKNSVLICGVGGVIKIDDPNNGKTDTT